MFGCCTDIHILTVALDVVICNKGINAEVPDLVRMLNIMCLFCKMMCNHNTETFIIFFMQALLIKYTLKVWKITMRVKD